MNETDSPGERSAPALPTGRSLGFPPANRAPRPGGPAPRPGGAPPPPPPLAGPAPPPELDLSTTNTSPSILLCSPLNAANSPQKCTNSDFVPGA